MEAIPRRSIWLATLSEFLCDPAGEVELFRRIDVHEGNLGRSIRGEGGFGNFQHPDAVEEADDLEAAREQPLFDVRQAGLAVDRVHGLELISDAGHDDVSLRGALHDEPSDLG